MLLSASPVADDTPSLKGITAQLASVVPGQAPPLERWHPERCGDIDIDIRRDGSWWHEGAPIKRQELVRLFASILRREDDGDYYLVTPVEKCRIRVQLHPLRIIDANYGGDSAANDDGSRDQRLFLTLNTGGVIPVDADHPLALEPSAGHALYVQLAHGLTALATRAAWYRLVELAGADGVLVSGHYQFNLNPDAT